MVVAYGLTMVVWRCFPLRHQRRFYLTPQMFLKRERGQSLLAQACGLSKRHRESALGLTVLDPFAGFGLDAFVLAHLGCEVLAVEQERMIWLMLCD